MTDRHRQRTARPRRARPRFLADKSIGVVGLGQIGGSIIRRLARYRPSLTLYATDRDQRLAARVRRYARWRESLTELVELCDIIVLAIPVPAILGALPQIGGSLRRHTPRRRPVVIDTGTAKHRIMVAARRQERWFEFAGLHPLAGSEQSGWGGSRSRLFAGRPMIVCPTDSKRATRAAREMIGLLGGYPIPMDAQQHDRLAAIAIGLPHVLAYLALNLGRSARVPNPLEGGSWASLTRVAASNPDMVAGFLAANATAHARVIRDLRTRLDEIIAILQRGDVVPDDLRRLLRRKE